jgi:tRNA(adenine34) deaminase
MSFDQVDFYYMGLALRLAETAERRKEVPVGVVLTSGGKIQSTSFNLRETHQHATSHAEILALNAASERLGSWRLGSCTIYITLEPCLMCAGALIQSRINRIVYGAKDPKGGAFGSLYSLHEDDRLNHKPTVESGLMADPCGQILRDFFQRKRSTRQTPEL